jgi:ABC-type transporter Mla subunit MlaD
VDLGSALAKSGRRGEATVRLNEAIAAAAQAMARLNASDKPQDDIDRLRKIGAAQRRARNELNALRLTGG